MLSLRIPSKVSVHWNKDFLKITGPLGVIIKEKKGLLLAVQNNRLYFLFSNNENNLNSHFYVSLINSIFIGVSRGYRKKLKLIGVGFRASVLGKILTLKIGYSHIVQYNIPTDVEVFCAKAKGAWLLLRGKERYRVCQVAAEIRALRKPDVYQGKGIRYHNEEITLKKGKRESK